MSLIKKVERNFLKLLQKLIENLMRFIQNLFNGGSAKLELVDSDDPLEAGLEMLVSLQEKDFNQ